MKHHGLLLPQGTFASDIKLLYLQMAQLWRYASIVMATTFSQQQILQWIVVACVLNMKFVILQTAKISRYAFVAMVTECPWQQFRAWIAVASRDLCCKCEVHLSSNSKYIIICLYYHGNTAFIAKIHTMDSCCLKESVYQIRTLYTFKEWSYKHVPLLPW